jgi:hypothetical protein
LRRLSEALPITTGNAMLHRAKFTGVARERIKPVLRFGRDLTLIIVGFLLATAWDMLKTKRDEMNELSRAARLVRFEIEQNEAIINQDLAYIDQDMNAAEQGAEAVTPITLLVHSSGDYAVLRGSFDLRSKNVTYMLARLYQQIADTNRQIEFRENYRNANESMSNFHRRRRLLDFELKNKLTGVTVITGEIEQVLVQKGL